MITEAAMIFRPLVAAAVRGAETLSATDKADVFEGIAELSASFDPVMSGDARSLAKAIRDAEGLQLHFRNLFARSEIPTQSE